MRIEPWNRYSFRAEPPRKRRYKEYPLPEK